MVQQKFVNKGSADPGMKGLKRRFSQGFTLIELMVVVIIIGVLAAVILPNVIGRDDDARAAVAKTDVNNIMQALKLYKLDNQGYPTSEQGLQALSARPTAGPAPANWKGYIEKLPNGGAGLASPGNPPLHWPSSAELEGLYRKTTERPLEQALPVFEPWHQQRG